MLVELLVLGRPGEVVALFVPGEGDLGLGGIVDIDLGWNAAVEDGLDGKIVVHGLEDGPGSVEFGCCESVHGLAPEAELAIAGLRIYGWKCLLYRKI